LGDSVSTIVNDLGKALIGIGIALVVIGALFWLGDKLPWFGRLPGDIDIKREHFRFYFPVTTCLFVSVVITLFFWLLRKR
jgi:hypothetical protein